MAGLAPLGPLGPFLLKLQLECISVKVLVPGSEWQEMLRRGLETRHPGQVAHLPAKDSA